MDSRLRGRSGQLDPCIQCHRLRLYCRRPARSALLLCLRILVVPSDPWVQRYHLIPAVQSTLGFLVSRSGPPLPADPVGPVDPAPAAVPLGPVGPVDPGAPALPAGPVGPPASPPGPVGPAIPVGPTIDSIRPELSDKLTEPPLVLTTTEI